MCACVCACVCVPAATATSTNSICRFVAVCARCLRKLRVSVSVKMKHTTDDVREDEETPVLQTTDQWQTINPTHVQCR